MPIVLYKTLTICQRAVRRQEVLPLIGIERLMQTTSSSRQNVSNRPSRLRILILVIGYLVALFGAMTIFSVQLYFSFLLLIAGLVVGTLALRPTPAMTPHSWLVVRNCRLRSDP